MLTAEESFANDHRAVFTSLIYFFRFLGYRVKLNERLILLGFRKLPDSVALSAFVVADVILRGEFRER